MSSCVCSRVGGSPLLRTGLVILLQAHIPTLIQNRMEKIVLLVTTANELVVHSVIDVEEVVSVFAGVLDKFRR